MKSEDGGQAFPRQTHGMGIDGMTLRDWFAGQALAGFLADSGARLVDQALRESEHANQIQDNYARARIVNSLLAENSYSLAEAMLLERAARPKERP